MPRLRTTAGFSLLLLLGGVAATGWLSEQTAGWAGPAKSMKLVAQATVHERAKPAKVKPALRLALRPSMPMVPVAARSRPASSAEAHAEEVPSLVPLVMPAVAVPYAELRGHLNGRVLLHLAINSLGQVTAAAVSQSSGDAVLDAHA
ncbi:energy transducer TonB, partial [Dyella silvatica]|uniref:energy transducer TonB n=1 Tax=Dyella silvatica TaxID=2992128 RepID=UPI00224F2D19